MFNKLYSTSKQKWLYTGPDIKTQRRRKAIREIISILSDTHGSESLFFAKVNSDDLTDTQINELFERLKKSYK